MTAKTEAQIHMPVWLGTILISAFFSVLLLLFNSINSRLDRIESKLDTHLMTKISYEKQKTKDVNNKFMRLVAWGFLF